MTMNPVSPDSDRYLDGTYLRHNPDWSELHGAWKATQIQRMLDRNRLRPSSICDVGCGTGAVLDHLARDLALTRVVGYDIAAEAIDLAPPDRRERITFVNQQPLSSNETFDVVLVIDVIEHVADYLGFLRALRPKGRNFAFHIPLDLSVQTVLRSSPLLLSREAVGHLHYFTRQTALATLEDSGYRVVDESFTPGGLEIPGRGTRTKLAAIPRRIAYRVHQDLAARVLGGFSLLVLAQPAD